MPKFKMTATVPELLAVQALMNVLDQFNAAEQERIVKISVAMLGHTWAGTWISTNKARRVVDVAPVVAALRRA